MTPDEKAQWLRALGRTPHTLAKTVNGVIWEIISYPYVAGDRVEVLVRIPGDPTTLRTADAISVHPEGAPCLCDIGGEFYFRDPPYMAAWRAAEVEAWEQAGWSVAVTSQKADAP
jgi:hypothetical protein